MITAVEVKNDGKVLRGILHKPDIAGKCRSQSFFMDLLVYGRKSVLFLQKPLECSRNQVLLRFGLTSPAAETATETFGT